MRSRILDGGNKSNIRSRQIKSSINNWFFGGGGLPVDIDAVYLNGYSIDPINRYVILYFNKPIYSGSGGALVASDLSLTFSQNGGTATAASITSVKNISNADLSGGEDTIRVNISITGTASGVEGIEIKPSSGSSIKDVDGGLAPVINNTLNDLINKTYDADYQNVLSYAITQGYSVPIKEWRNVENALMIEAKAIGLFALTDVMIPLTPWGDRNYALIDWKRLTTCTIIGTLNYTRGTGFVPTGAGVIDTLWSPSGDGVNYTLNAASAICNVIDDLQNNLQQLYGTNHSDGVTSKRLGLLARNTSNAASPRLNSSALSTVTTITTSVGIFHQNRGGALAADHDLFIEGALVDGSGTASSALPDLDLVLFGERAANGTITGTSRTTQRINLFFFAGNTLSIAAAIKTMRDNYNTAIAAVGATSKSITTNGVAIANDTPEDLFTDD